jgi:hypothetical protein
MIIQKIAFLVLVIILTSNPPQTKKLDVNSPNITSTGIEKKISKENDSLDYESKIEGFKKLLDNQFIYDKCTYFVIISNLDSVETDNIRNNTIVPAVECFYNDFFEKKPTEVTVIFLFKDDASYRYWADKLYSDDGLSRFGYYKPDERVMLMNISTGTGTLVHEMTHALVHFDFPDIPAWFNEGLGSLYERCSLKNGNIRGFVNWRLPILKEAIYNHSYTALDKLLQTGDNEFYGSKSDFYYSQARYLCMYIQEKDLLKSYYKQFRDNFEEDKSGKKFLEDLLNKKLKVINTDFLQWVNTLKYN